MRRAVLHKLRRDESMNALHQTTEDKLFEPRSETKFELVVVIVDYKTPQLTIDCIASLESERQEHGSFAVVVCENGGDPDSLRTLMKCVEDRGYNDWVFVTKSVPNRGFSGGNNAVLGQLLKWAFPPQYVMLLNSDTVVRPGALTQLLNGLRQDSDVGIIGPRLEWPDGTPQPSCFRDRSPLNEFLRAADTGPITRLLSHFDGTLPVTDSPVYPDWISFACVVIRLEVIVECGLLDDGFFMYFDDADYCRHVRRHQWKTLYWPRAHVVHLRGGSGPVKSLTAARKRRPRYWYDSRARYYFKYYGRIGLWAANFLWMLGRSISKAREVTGTKTPRACNREWMDNWTRCCSRFRYSGNTKLERT